jgi:hypothetical protein
MTGILLRIQVLPAQNVAVFMSHYRGQINRAFRNVNIGFTVAVQVR